MWNIPEKVIKKFIFVAGSLLILAACLPVPVQSPDDSQSVETVVALTFEALTSVAPPAAPTTAPTQVASGLPVSYNNIAFTIPLELNASATPVVTTDVEYPYINPSNGPMPEHVRFDFTNYPLEGNSEILVFKASEYAAYGNLQEVVTALLAGQDANAPFPEALVNADFYAHAQPIRFQNGHGVRYLEQTLTAVAPVNNRELFYYYQGITDDGAYFVSARLHTSAPFLVADEQKDSPTPPDGVPFGWEQSDFDFASYLQSISQKLNEAPEESFTPSLATLDRLIESLTISAP